MVTNISSKTSLETYTWKAKTYTLLNDWSASSNCSLCKISWNILKLNNRSKENQKTKRNKEFAENSQSTSNQPLQQLLRSPPAAPGFAPVPLTERRQGATTLRTERRTGPGDRHRQAAIYRGWSRWGSCCASLRLLKPAMRKMWNLRKEIENCKTGPRPPYHQSHSIRGRDKWGSCCAARRRPKPAMCKMWHVKEIENCKTRASTPLSPKGFSRRSISVRLWLCFIALARASDVQTVKSERNWKLQDPGLNTLITNLIATEVKVGEGDVVLQGVG